MKFGSIIVDINKVETILEESRQHFFLIDFRNIRLKGSKEGREHSRKSCTNYTY